MEIYQPKKFGSYFSYSLQGSSYFEGFDIVIICFDSYIHPCCDKIMNDCSDGYNIETGLKSSFWDGDIKKFVTVSYLL
jgi:hypothetical protein